MRVVYGFGKDRLFNGVSLTLEEKQGYDPSKYTSKVPSLQAPFERLEGGVWVPYQDKPPELSPLPKQLLQCTKVQAIAALSHAGLLAEFQEFIRNADPLTQALWEASYLLQSDSPTLLAVWAGMGKTEQELYDLFQVAMEIKV